MVNQQHGENRWVRAVIPALLIHISIGTVYCWSVFKQLIADQMHVAPGIVEWGFSLAIFFLGMSAAFLGPFVEKDIKKSALISTVCFVCGFAGTGVSIAAGWLPGVFIFYGVIMGIGLGVGYLTPVKNLMLWFADNKGLATGIAVAGFGLAKAIASPVMQWLISTVGLAPMFYILAAVYAVMMLLGFALIKRPAGYVYSAETRIRRRDIMKKPVFWAIWLAFYLNITCGLALISQEKDILHDALSTLPKYASLNAAQLATAIAVCALQIFTHSIDNGTLWLIVTMLFLVNAGYGGGFSTLPVLLEQHFGMKSVSTVHGLALSAWAFAGLSGNQLASFVVSHTADAAHRYSALIPIITVLYAVALASIIAVVLGTKGRRAAAQSN